MYSRFDYSFFLENNLVPSCVRNVGQRNYNADRVELTLLQLLNPKIMQTKGFLEKFLSKRKPGQLAHSTIPLRNAVTHVLCLLWLKGVEGRSHSLLCDGKLCLTH